MNGSTEERFWSKVDRSGPTPPHMPELGNCWVWTRSRFRSGYGCVCIEGKTMRAHRVAWELAHGRIPAKLWVLHKCDNAACVRIDHLFIGTTDANMADMVAKGRQAAGERHGSYIHPESRPFGDRNGSRRYPERRPRGDNNTSRMYPERRPRGDAHYSKTKPELLARGEKHGNAKLTEIIVRSIRAEHAAGCAMRALSRKYSIDRSVISDIIRRKLWKHVA
jgi:hypothetical protein